MQSALPNPLVVKVMDGSGNPKPGAALTWTITGSSGASGQTVDGDGTTGADGQAEATVTLGNKPGEYQITVTCPECTEGSPVTFTTVANSCTGLSLELSPAEIWPDKTDGFTNSLIMARVSKPAPSGGCEVKFEVEPVLSKGHNHGTHPKEKAGQLTPESCTIAEGTAICSVIYYAPEISGEEKIIGKLMSGSQVKETKDSLMRIRVPDLGLLSGGAFLELLPSDRHGLENHYGTSAMVQKVISLALAYNSDLQQKEGVINNLRIGNISLPWGGLFDVFGNWTTPHKSHRIGINVDISRHVVDEHGNPVNFGTLQPVLDDIAVNQLNLKRRTEDSIEECPSFQHGEPPCIHYSLY